MTSFVCVAGAFHGAWAWTEVCRKLAARGYDCHRLDLTGQGARRHLAGPLTNLSTHIEDVVAFVEAEDLRSVTLVGHSYAGMVITGAADRIPDKIERLVYLDAVVPRNGQTGAEIAGHAVIGKAVELAASGDGWSVPCFFPIKKFGDFDDERKEWLVSKLGSHPLRTWFEPLRLDDAFSGSRAFLYCTVDPLGLFDDPARAARESADWTYLELSAPHDAMITDPDLVVDSLLRVIAKAG